MRAVRWILKLVNWIWLLFLQYPVDAHFQLIVLGAVKFLKLTLMNFSEIYTSVYIQTQQHTVGQENQLMMEIFYFSNGNHTLSQWGQSVASFLHEDFQGWGPNSFQFRPSDFEDVLPWVGSELFPLWFYPCYLFICSLAKLQMIFSGHAGKNIFLELGDFGSSPNSATIGHETLSKSLLSTLIFLSAEWGAFQFCNSIQHHLDTLHLFKDSYQISW